MSLAERMRTNPESVEAEIASAAERLWMIGVPEKLADEVDAYCRKTGASPLAVLEEAIRLYLSRNA